MNDPHANFKAEVAAYTLQDPMPTIERLSAETGVPADEIVRYVLVKYAASAADALLAMKPIVLRQMLEIVERAENGDHEARLAAFEALRQIIHWLASGDADAAS